jgi:hypothetical protein
MRRTEVRPICGRLAISNWLMPARCSFRISAACRAAVSGPAKPALDRPWRDQLAWSDPVPRAVTARLKPLRQIQTRTVYKPRSILMGRLRQLPRDYVGQKHGKKEGAIAALLTNRNLEEAAKATGIATNTLLRWMKGPEFKTACLDAFGLRLASRSRVFSRPPVRPRPHS